MRVSAFVSSGPAVPVAVGEVVAQLAENLYSVKFQVPDTGTIIEVGTRVVTEKVDGTTAAGLVAHVHGDGTFSILYDDDTLEENVPRKRISVSSGRLAMNSGALTKYEGVVNWIKDAGVQKRIDILSAAIVLYRRGWRRENMYLLEFPDVHCLSHLNKSVRQGILEAAEDEKSKRRLKREMAMEQLKEQQNWRYKMLKYSGFVATMSGFFGVCSVFFWNFKNYRRQQRPAQVENAVSTMLNSIYKRRLNEDEMVARGETERLCHFIQGIDKNNPQLIFVTGNHGSGKSTCITDAARQTRCPHVIVELRGSEKQDPIRAVVRGMGVTSLDLCGDLFQFVNEVCKELRRVTGNVPIIVLKPKGGFIQQTSSLLSGGGGVTGGAGVSGSGVGTHGGGNGVMDFGYIFNDALSLVSERHCANVIIELDTESLTQLPHLPRTAIFHLEDMTENEATKYLAHRIDPVAITELLSTVGTNTIDLDECISAVRHHEVDIDDFICGKLSKAIAAIRRQPLDVQAILSEVAQQPFQAGVRRRPPRVDEAIQKGFLMYHWENQAWIFRSKLHYEAAKIVGAWD